MVRLISDSVADDLAIALQQLIVEAGKKPSAFDCRRRMAKIITRVSWGLRRVEARLEEEGLGSSDTRNFARQPVLVQSTSIGRLDDVVYAIRRKGWTRTSILGKTRHGTHQPSSSNISLWYNQSGRERYLVRYQSH